MIFCYYSLVSVIADVMTAPLGCHALGSLMNEYQALFDASLAPMSTELSAPVLHKCLDHFKTNFEGRVLGGKGVGSQGDGSAQLLCATAEDQAEVAAAVEKELGMNAILLTIRA